MILFDLDGTLVDSSKAILSAYQAAIQDCLGFLIAPDEEHVHDLLRRRPSEYFQQHYPPHAEALTASYARNYRSDGVTAFPGIVTALECFGAAAPLGIVSNKGRARILSDLLQVGLEPARFAVIVGAEDTARRKPHPDPILKALEHVAESQGPVVYVGDGPHDVLAARAAGVLPLGVSWGYYPAEALVAAGAAQVVSDVAGLAAVLEGMIG